MTFTNKERICFWIGFIDAVFFYSMINLILSCINNYMIGIYIFTGWMILSALIYFILLNRLNKKPETTSLLT
jgi:hypothetical protein